MCKKFEDISLKKKHKNYSFNDIINIKIFDPNHI